MNLNHAIIIIAAMFTAMLAWNIWWLFFSKEAIIFKSKNNMTARKNFIHDPSQRKLIQKLTDMRENRDKLEAALVDNYNPDQLRQLNLLDHHIEIAEKRLGGEWNNGHEATVSDLVLHKRGVQHLTNAWV